MLSICPLEEMVFVWFKVFGDSVFLPPYTVPRGRHDTRDPCVSFYIIGLLF